MTRRAIALTTVLVAAAAACRDTPTVEICPSDLRYSVQPDSRTLSIGESLTPQVTALGCYGTKVLETPRWIWRSSDTLVLRVDSLSGTATARGTGTARVYPTWVGNSDTFGVTIVVR